MAERIEERRHVEAAAGEHTIVSTPQGRKLSFSPARIRPSGGPLPALATCLAFVSVECNIACRHSGRAGGQHMISTAYGR